MRTYVSIDGVRMRHRFDTPPLSLGVQYFILKIFGKFSERLPLIHLAALVIGGAIISTSWLLWPRGSAPHALSAAHLSDQSDATASQSRSKALTVHQPDTEKLSPLPEQNWTEYVLHRGDNLHQLFQRAGLSNTDYLQVSLAARTHSLFKDLKQGQTIAFQVAGGQLTRIRYNRDPLHRIELIRSSSHYRIFRITRTPQIVTHLVSGTVHSRFASDAIQAGLPTPILQQVTRIASWASTTPDAASTFDVLYQDRLIDGKAIDDGQVLAMKLGQFTAVRFVDNTGKAAFYHADGSPLRSPFLRTPVAYRRISSPFMAKRMHPVLGIVRPHEGVDYAAPIGTPVHAASDGKIIWLGSKQGYGRTIVIQHGGNISTLYAHMSRYNEALRSGGTVTQGEVIGYVGQSGLATGPHLHYEYRVNGVHKDPTRVKLPSATPIAGSEHAAFAHTADRLLSQLSQQATTIAQRDQNGNNG